MAKVTRMIRVTVQFHIDGTTYTVSNVYYPDGDSQLAWVRWTTPDEPQDMTIDVDVSGPGSAQATIHCKIVDLDENPPPNPVADDRNDSFTPSPVPDRPEKTSASGPFGTHGGRSIGYGMAMMRTDTGATTAGGNLIWTATVPAFPLLWKLLQTRRIPPPATAP